MTKTVYIVMEHYDDDDSHIIGVFTTRALADACLEQHANTYHQNERDWYIKRHSSIEEHVLLDSLEAS